MAGANFNFDFDAIKANLSVVKFEHDRLFNILTAGRFNDVAAKSWIDDHFYLTIQVGFAFLYDFHI